MLCTYDSFPETVAIAKSSVNAVWQTTRGGDKIFIMKLQPVFIKGNLEFTIDQFLLEFKNRNISSFGVYGLPWPPLTPKNHFGRQTQVSIHISSPFRVDIETKALITHERSIQGELMGLKFQLERETRQMLSELIREHGFYPTEYIRKYPRIPTSERIKTFPLKVVGVPVNTDSTEPQGSPIIFEVRDLSLNGLLIASDNPFAIALSPGTRLELYLEPRGDFMARIKVAGMVCRIMDEIQAPSGNLMRSLGVKFTRIDEEDRVAFLELLKDILGKIKDDFPASVTKA